MLFELPLGPEDLGADAALLRVLGIVDFQVKAQSAKLLEALLALGTLKDPIQGVDLKKE